MVYVSVVTRVATTRLEEVLVAQGRSRVWLSAQLGVSRQVVHRWLKGLEPMPRARAERAAVLLGVPIEEISEGE